MIIRNYLLKIQIKVMCMKRRMMNLLGKKKHIHHIMALQDIDKDRDLKFLTENVKDIGQH